jgi:hypothetical protein
VRSRLLKLMGTLTIAIAVAWLAPIPTAGQAPVSSTTASTGAPSRTGTPRRLPDGQPDIQGIYTNQWVVPIERFTKEERDAFEKAIVAHRGENPGAYGYEWFDRPDGGTDRPVNSPHPPGHVAVIDPPEGRIPWQPWALAKKTYIRDHPFETRAIYDYRIRCLPAGTPRGTFYSYYNGWQIQQPPGRVVILYEHNHLYRVIRLDGSPHPGPNIQLWMGDSIGRWEGNTLVVDVRNFTGKTWVVGDLGGEGMHTGSFHSPALHVVERFTIVDANNIDYEATIEDPNVFTNQWKLGFRVFSRAPSDYKLFEYACHEGNKTIDLMKDVFKR